MIPVAGLNNPLCCDVADNVVFTVAAESANMIAVSCQFQRFGKNLAVPGAFKAYLSSDAAGLVPSSGAPSGGVAAGASGAVIEDIADLSFTLVTTATGLVIVNVTDSGTSAIYVNVVTPDGRIHTAACPFA